MISIFNVSLSKCWENIKLETFSKVLFSFSDKKKKRKRRKSNSCCAKYEYMKNNINFSSSFFKLLHLYDVPSSNHNSIYKYTERQSLYISISCHYLIQEWMRRGARQKKFRLEIMTIVINKHSRVWPQLYTYKYSFCRDRWILLCTWGSFEWILTLCIYLHKMRALCK